MKGLDPAPIIWTETRFINYLNENFDSQEKIAKFIAEFINGKPSEVLVQNENGNSHLTVRIGIG